MHDNMGKMNKVYKNKGVYRSPCAQRILQYCSKDKGPEARRFNPGDICPGARRYSREDKGPGARRFNPGDKCPGAQYNY